MQKPTSLRIPAKIEHITDGDTYRVSLTFEVNVRVIGTDTPELRSSDKEEKQRGLEAKRYVYEHLYEVVNSGEWPQGKTVMLDIPLNSNLSNMFTLGRLLARVEDDKLGDIAQHLNEKGLGQPWKKQ
jgi:endonuclease YncB( thermonuclease family)